ncbi:MAG TPA: hypothetical protein VEW95_09540 [Candidatus Limnocylindrales bacterium]|nr:hypothetical protein [Candidatus Limnocylindrales bacterium]
MTRDDIEAIHAEFLRGTTGLFTGEQLDAITEHLVYIKGAIEDYRHPPAARRKMRRRWEARKARAPREASSREAPAMLTPRATAAA